MFGSLTEEVMDIHHGDYIKEIYGYAGVTLN
jgi:hypothetical protein